MKVVGHAADRAKADSTPRRTRRSASRSRPCSTGSPGGPPPAGNMRAFAACRCHARSAPPSTSPRSSTTWRRARARRDARVWAVVKANAYGHGLLRARRALDAADGFALLDLDEAVRLRDAGVRKPILLLEGVFDPEDLAPIARQALSIVVHSNEQIAMLESVRPTPRARGVPQDELRDEPARIRPVDQVGASLERLAATGSVAEITLMTHFADADGPHGRRRAAALASRRPRRGLDAPRSLANSAAAAALPRDALRTGYGRGSCSTAARRSRMSPRRRSG